MDFPVCIGELYEIYDELPDLLNETINSFESSLLSSNLKELTLDVKENYLLTSKRDAVIEKMKVSVIHETLNSLKSMQKNFERWNDIVHDPRVFHHGGDMHSKLRTKLERIVNNFNEIFGSLNNNVKSPYDLETILDPDYFKQSLKIHPTNNKHDRARMYIGLAQSELKMTKESSKTNEMQKVILALHLEKLKAFGDQITSSSLISTESKKKKKSSKSNETNKICEIMKKCQRLIKDVYQFMYISSFKDSFNERDEIFNVINEKGSGAIPEVLEFIESIKDDWLDERTENTTQATCRSVALRRLNTTLKLLKKLNQLKEHLPSSFIVLGLKNIATDTLKIDGDFKIMHERAYFLTFKPLPKSRIDVPDNFVRKDPVYEEIYQRHSDVFFTFYIHLSIFDQYLNSLSWNPFQRRKPYELKFYLSELFRTTDLVWCANFTQDESYQIALDLADRYLMTKQKIEYDRESLAFRFGCFKPLKPYKFPEIHAILQSRRRFYYKKCKLADYMIGKFDDHINKLNRKVTNRGQLIVFERSMSMMKRSIHTLRIIRWTGEKNNDLYIKLVMQAINEYLYAAEIVVKLLDFLRPNRRITFSFSANGPFIKKMDSIGLKVKDEFLETVNSQIETLKGQLKDKEADLETVKSEKTQLKYLQSISTRINLIPIKELEMTNNDNIEILREIIEEFEFTNIQYGYL